jgi:hypothetical protein
MLVVAVLRSGLAPKHSIGKGVLFRRAPALAICQHGLRQKQLDASSRWDYVKYELFLRDFSPFVSFFGAGCSKPLLGGRLMSPLRPPPPEKGREGCIDELDRFTGGEPSFKSQVAAWKLETQVVLNSSSFHLRLLSFSASRVSFC